MKLRWLVLFCTLVLSVPAQVPNVFTSLWRSTFNTAGFDAPQKVALDSAGNFVVAGQTYSEETHLDGLVLKINPAGQRLWARRFDSRISGDDIFTQVATDAAGNVAVVGFSAERDSSSAFVVASYDSASGAQRWVKVIPGEYIGASNGAVGVDSTGNVIASIAVEDGSSQILRTFKFRGNDGAGMWTNDVRSARDFRFGFISQLPMLVTPDGGCFLGGLTNYAVGDLDWMVVRLRPDGSPAGHVAAGTPRHDSQPMMSYHSSGDLLLSGVSENVDGGLEILLQRLRLDGSQVWQTKLGGASMFKAGSHYPVSLRSSAGGEILIAGNSPGWGGFVSRFTATGFLDWTIHFKEASEDIVPLPGGQSFVTLDDGVGWIDNNGCLLKHEPGKRLNRAVADSAGSVYLAHSYFVPESIANFGLAAEKLIMDRPPGAPSFTKLQPFAGGLPQQAYELAPEVGGANLKYFWSYTGTDLPGFTNRTLTIPTLNATTIGYYQLEVTNEFGSTRCPDIELLTYVPLFIRQPKSQVLVPGGDLAFSALAVGFEPQEANTGVFANYLTYQWQYADDFTFIWQDIQGETKSKLLVREADEDWAGYYYFGTWYNYYYRCVATLVYPQIPGGVGQMFSDFAKVEFPWDYVEEVSTNRSSWVLTGEPWSKPTSMALRPAGGVHVSMESDELLFRVDINNKQIVSFTGENFRPAQNVLPRGPHLIDSLGNYYSIGETNRQDTALDWIVTRHAPSGQVLWAQTIGSLGHVSDSVADANIDKEENLIIAGWAATAKTGRDFLTICLRKEDGQIRWSAAYNDPKGVAERFAGERVSQIGIDANGNVYVAGIGNHPDANVYILVSYDSSGAQRFVYQYPFDFSVDENLLIAVDTDGSSVLAGSFGLLKIDTFGRQLWQTDPRPRTDFPPNYFYGLQLDKAGNIFVSGYGAYGYNFEKYDAFGKFQVAVKEDVFPETIFQPGSRFFLDDFGNIYLPGTGGNTFSEKDIFLLKLDPYLTRLWAARVDGVASGGDQAFDVRVRGQDIFLTGTVDEKATTAVSLAQFWEDPNPVKITHLRRSQTVRKGSNFSAGVTTVGAPNKFGWYRDGVRMPGQTTGTLNIPNIDYAHEGFYFLVATNNAGYIGTSGGFALRVAEAPQFVAHPQSTNVPVRGEIRLSAAVNGTEPMTLQWLVDGQPVAGATNTSLVIAEAEFQNRGQYRLAASNEWGIATSLSATVGIIRPPNLPPIVKLSEPLDGAVRKDLGPVLFRAKVYDPDGRVIRVVFRVNGELAANVTAEPFETMWTPPAPGVYRVTAEAIDNLLAIGKSEAVDLVVANEPTILQQPGPTQTIPENGDLVLTADATGIPPPRYQWRLNGANIPGATNRTYTVGGAQVKHSGKYAVLVVNEGAAKISSQTEVIVSAEPLIMSDKLSEAITRSDAQFTGRASNVGATREVNEPNHARRKGGSSIWMKWKAPASGVLTLNTRGSAIDTLLAVYQGLDIPNIVRIAADDERGGFHCSLARFNAIKDQIYLFAVDGFKGQSGNVVLSWALDSSARELPLLQEEPVGVSAILGAARQFQPIVVGSNLKFQWYQNGYPIPGATTLGLSFASLSKTNLGNYVLRVSNDDGSVESIVAELESASVETLITQDRAEDLRLVSVIGNKAFSAGYPTISPGIPYQHLFNTQGSSTDNDEPIIGDGGGASKWFMVTAGGPGTLVADTSGSQFTTLLTLHDGSNFDTLPVLATGTALPDGSSHVQHPALAGKSYVMRVDGPEGNVVLNVNIGSAPLMSATPLDRIMSAGESTTLWASVTAAPAATFQWYLNNVALVGKTAISLPITNFNEAQVGMYELEARNPLASIRKIVAYLELRRDTTFSPLTKVPGGDTQLRIEGNNQTYYIDATEDFLTWTMNIFSARSENGVLIFTEPNMPLSTNRFYRARSQ